MAEYLPEAKWMSGKGVSELIAALGPRNARFVGGAVRDTLLGLDVKDIDIATPLQPQEVIALLDGASIRNVPTGIEHGTVTALLPSGPVEITTLRHDVSTDGRRATVAFSTDWQDDAARRDFTINALYADPITREISDYFGGLADLDRRCVRFIGDARARILEDHLRILRYFRFQARFGSEPADQESETACTELAATLKGLSRERIGMETMNLLGLANPAPTIARMAELNVLQVILPEAQPEALAKLVAHEKAQNVQPDALRRLAALLPADPALASQVASRFRLSNAAKKRLVTAAKRSEYDGNPRALAYQLGRAQALDHLLVTGSDTSALSNWDIPIFPMKGGEIMARGVSAGPDIARILHAVERRWVNEGFPDRDRVERMLDEELAP